MAAIDVTISSGSITVVEFSRGYSGYSGYSGKSGFSGSNPGASGYSGYSGKSGYSGISGRSGYSGISGFSGYSGRSAYSGYSGVGTSGFSGYSGASGFSGYSGTSGFSGYSGKSGYSGISGYSGYSGALGYAVYEALLTQTGTNAPTATVLVNTLGFTPTYGYTSVGEYTINSTAGWTVNKTFVYMPSAKGGAGTFNLITFEKTSTSVITVNTTLVDLNNPDNVDVNAVLNATEILIEVWP